MPTTKVGILIYTQEVMYAFLFIFGLAIGSFLNVLAIRYDGDHWVWDPKVIGGRSHCPHCGKTLRWFELIPLASFLVQRGRCRNCKARLALQYPIVELFSGLIFLFVPLQLASYPWLANIGWYAYSAIWIVVFEILLLISVIDIRLQIIPDELTGLLGIVALIETTFASLHLGPDHQTFFGSYAYLFGIYNNVWGSHFAGAVILGGFFWLLVVATPRIFKKEGMGMGDAKLAIVFGLLFGWPDILFLVLLAFVAGAIIGVALIVLHEATRTSAVPFVPFLAFAATYVFFFGFTSVDWYFRIIGL